MSRRIVFVAGHGAGDTGARGNGTTEAVETRRVVNALLRRIRGSVAYPLERNLFEDIRRNQGNWRNFFRLGDMIVEIHLNGFILKSANGTELIIRKGLRTDATNQAITNALARHFKRRRPPTGFYFKNLQNNGVFAGMGMWYCLPEICFITNANDMRIYNQNFDRIMDDLARAIGGADFIQPAPPQAPSTGNQLTHVVQRGETLESIARRHGVTVAQLAEWNGIRNPNLIKVGQRLVVRLGAPPPITPQPPAPQVPATPPAVTGQNVLQYSVHVQNRGWMQWVRERIVAGTTGLSLRLEAIRIAISNIVGGGGIRYRVHVQNVGWQDWVANGAIGGTTGRGLRAEAIQIELTGELARTHRIEYRVHVQNRGWMGWVSDGAIAGTTGQSLRMEAIEIRLVRR